MNRRISILLTAASLLVVFGCSEQQTPSGPGVTVETLKPGSGQFGLSSLGSMAKRTAAAAVKSGPQVTFNLGQIKGSSGFFFLLYNVGMTPITNVTLSIANQSYAVFPASMDTLIPGSDVGMLPIVKVSAFHGTPMDGVGTRPLLPMGDNTFTLRIQGNSKTASGNDTVITLDAELNLKAMVMDLEMESSAGPMNYSMATQNFESVFKGIDGLENEPVYYGLTRCINDNDVIVKNSGNVPLHITVYSSEQASDAQMVSTHLFDSTVAVAGTCQFPFDAAAKDQYYLIIASGENTVSDPLKLPLHDNGSFYLVVTQGSGNCEDTLVNKKYDDFLAAHAQDDCAKAWLLIDNRVLFYGQSFNSSDSVHFALIDLRTDALITECAGTKTGDATVLVQADGYTGEYLSIFTNAIAATLEKLDTKGISSRVSSGGMSGDWVRSSSVSFE